MFYNCEVKLGLFKEDETSDGIQKMCQKLKQSKSQGNVESVALADNATVPNKLKYF